MFEVLIGDGFLHRGEDALRLRSSSAELSSLSLGAQRLPDHKEAESDEGEGPNLGPGQVAKIHAQEHQAPEGEKSAGNHVSLLALAAGAEHSIQAEDDEYDWPVTPDISDMNESGMVEQYEEADRDCQHAHDEGGIETTIFTCHKASQGPLGARRLC